MALKTHPFAGTDAANDTTDTNKPPPAITHYPTIAADGNTPALVYPSKKIARTRDIKDKFYFLSFKSIVLMNDLSFLSKCPFLDLSFLHCFLNHPSSHFLSHLPYFSQQQEQHPFLWHSALLQSASQQQQSLPANVAAAPPIKPIENIPTLNSFITDLLYKTRYAFATER